MRKVLMSICLMVLLGSMAFAAGQQEDNGMVKVAYLQRRGDEPHFQAQAAGFKERAEALGMEAIIMDCKLNPEVTMTNVDTAIAMGVKGIANCLVDPKLAPAIMSKANAAGVAIIGIDMLWQDKDGKQIAPYLGLDNGPIGASAGVWLGEYVKNTNWSDNPANVGIAAMTYNEIGACQDRTDNSEIEIVKLNPWILSENIHGLNYAKADTAGGMESMQTLISKYPEIKHWIVYSCNDEGVVGAVRALEQAGLDAESIGCGIGGALAPGEFEKSNGAGTAFKASAFVDAASVGAQAADMFKELLIDGKELAMFNPAESIIITKDNYKPYF